jgi:dihydroceramidase
MAAAAAAAAAPPYWGARTASEDWCEPNYVYSPYVAEWWNTLSSLPMVFFSLAALALGVRHGYPKRLLLPSLLTACVGLGSVAFHGSLLYGGQAMDELSMVLAATAFLYVGLEGDPRRVALPLLAPALALWSAAFVASYVYLKDTAYFLFFVVVFVALSVRCCYTAYLLHLRTADGTLRRLYFCGQALWVAAFGAFWLPDKLVRGARARASARARLPAMPFSLLTLPLPHPPLLPPPLPPLRAQLCDTVQPLNLHAIFHVMTAVAVMWYHAHHVHCFFTSLYALRTGGKVRDESGADVPAPRALLEFLELSVAPEAQAAAPAPAAPLQLQHPTLVYFGIVGPFVALEQVQGKGPKAT